MVRKRQKWDSGPTGCARSLGSIMLILCPPAPVPPQGHKMSHCTLEEREIDQISKYQR